METAIFILLVAIFLGLCRANQYLRLISRQQFTQMEQQYIFHGNGRVAGKPRSGE